MAGTGLLLVVLVYKFGRFTPEKAVVSAAASTMPADPLAQSPASSTDTILLYAKKGLPPSQSKFLEKLEKGLHTDNAVDAQLAAYHKLAHFWKDSVQLFEPYAWYEAESARLENSEKSLTFAARLFLENLQADQNGSRRQWKALQAKELYERSLKINPDNDSSKIGIGACFLFGNISSNPLEGISMIKDVIQRDSTNVYAQITLVKGSLISGQYQKGIERLLTILKQEPSHIEAVLMLADLYERTGEKKKAVVWYGKSLKLISSPEIQKAIQDRIEELNK